MLYGTSGMASASFIAKLRPVLREFWWWWLRWLWLRVCCLFDELVRRERASLPDRLFWAAATAAAAAAEATADDREAAIEVGADDDEEEEEEEDNAELNNDDELLPAESVGEGATSGPPLLAESGRLFELDFPSWKAAEMMADDSDDNAELATDDASECAGDESEEEEEEDWEDGEDWEAGACGDSAAVSDGVE